VNWKKPLSSYVNIDIIIWSYISTLIAFSHSGEMQITFNISPHSQFQMLGPVKYIQKFISYLEFIISGSTTGLKLWGI
jgi:hypothetical protein